MVLKLVISWYFIINIYQHIATFVMSFACHQYTSLSRDYMINSKNKTRRPITDQSHPIKNKKHAYHVFSLGSIVPRFIMVERWDAYLSVFYWSRETRDIQYLIKCWEFGIRLKLTSNIQTLDIFAHSLRMASLVSIIFGNVEEGQAHGGYDQVKHGNFQST